MRPTAAICCRRSSRVNSLRRSRRSRASASSRATAASARSTRLSTSPIPSMRETRRSGRNASRSSRRSPVAANTTGTPTTETTDRAAPPRASPSILLSTTPVTPMRWWNSPALRMASCPVIASATYSTSDGVTCLPDRRQLVHQRVVDVQAPRRVDQHHVEAAVCAPPSRRRAPGPTGSPDSEPCTRRAGLPAEHGELLDGRRPAARRSTPAADAAPAVPASVRAWPWSWSSRTPGARPAARPAGARTTRSAPGAARRRARAARRGRCRPPAAPASGCRGRARSTARSRTRSRNARDDLEVDVRLEQRQPDPAQRRLDAVRRQAHLAPERTEHVLHAGGEGVEHLRAPRRMRRRPARPRRSTAHTGRTAPSTTSHLSAGGEDPATSGGVTGARHHCWMTAPAPGQAGDFGVVPGGVSLSCRAPGCHGPARLGTLVVIRDRRPVTCRQCRTTMSRYSACRRSRPASAVRPGARR